MSAHARGEPRRAPIIRGAVRETVSGWLPPAIDRTALGRLLGTADIVILSLIVATLPFEFTKRFMPASWLEVSRVFIAAGIVLLGVRVVIVPRTFDGLPRGIAGAIVAILAVDALSVFLTHWPGATREVALIVVYAAFALFVAATLTTRERFAVATRAFLVAVVVVAVIGIAEQATGVYLWKDRPLEVFGRRNSTFADPNITGRYLVLSLQVAFTVLAVGIARHRRAVLLLLLALVVMTTAALVFTLSRTAWILLFLSIAVWGPLAVRRRDAVLAAGVCVAIVTFVGLVFLNANVMTRVGDIPPPEAAAVLDETSSEIPERPTAIDGIARIAPLDEVRRYLLRAGVAMFQDHPPLGIGLDGFAPEILGPYRAYIPQDRRSGPTSLQHTEVVRVAAETGIAGLATFAAFILAVAVALRRAARGADPDDLVVVVALATSGLTILLSAQMEGRFFSEPYLWLYLGALAAFVRIRTASPARSTPLA